MASFIFRFKFFKRKFGKRNFKLLDIGAGNNSGFKTKKVFPNCEYYGLDINKNYNNESKNFLLMADFYELDLTHLQYDIIPNNYFDCICMSHVIEHLPNGDKVAVAMLNKLKPGGYFYIEYPGKKSLTLPSCYGTLNFKDDPTHIRVYSVDELSALFKKRNCIIESAGIRRNWWYIIALPVRLCISLIKYRKINGNVFWDILGFAEYLFIKKKYEST